MDNYLVLVDGLEDLKDLQSLPAEVLLAAQRAVNATTRRTKTSSARSIRSKVAFPARYLSGEKGRLQIAKLATKSSLEGIIRGKARPTSLAQFASAKAIGKAGVKVQVKPGSSVEMKKAFLLRLPQGSTLTDTKFNLGLAVRLRAGERIQNKRAMVQVSKGLYLLYGPSVNQVFASVADDESEEAAAFLEREFLRLVDL